MVNVLMPVLFVLLLSTCGNGENVTFKKCWSLAERGDGFQLYYPCGDARLVPSRFSPTYKFHAKDTCEYLVLSPVDAHYMEEGIYEHNPELSILTVKTTEGDLIVKFKILSISEREMKVKELENHF